MSTTPQSPRAVRNWASDWSRFSENHSRWVAQHLQNDGPVYSLSPILARELARPLRDVALLSASDSAAERDFARLCRAHFACGVLNGQPILFPFLAPPPVPVPRTLLESMTELGWTQQDIAAAERLTQGEVPTDSLNARLKGWLGILISDPKLVEERDEIRARRGRASKARPTKQTTVEKNCSGNRFLA